MLSVSARLVGGREKGDASLFRCRSSGGGVAEMEVDDQGQVVGGVAGQPRVDDPGVADLDRARGRMPCRARPPASRPETSGNAIAAPSPG